MRVFHHVLIGVVSLALVGVVLPASQSGGVHIQKEIVSTGVGGEEVVQEDGLWPPEPGATVRDVKRRQGGVRSEDGEYLGARPRFLRYD